MADCEIQRISFQTNKSDFDKLKKLESITQILENYISFHLKEKNKEIGTGLKSIAYGKQHLKFRNKYRLLVIMRKEILHLQQGNEKFLANFNLQKQKCIQKIPHTGSPQINPHRHAAIFTNISLASQCPWGTNRQF